MKKTTYVSDVAWDLGSISRFAWERKPGTYFKDSNGIQWLKTQRGSLTLTNQPYYGSQIFFVSDENAQDIPSMNDVESLSMSEKPKFAMLHEKEYIQYENLKKNRHLEYLNPFDLTAPLPHQNPCEEIGENGEDLSKIHKKENDKVKYINSALFSALEIANNVLEERHKQDLKWDKQDHPDLDPVLTEREGGATPQRFAEQLEIPTAERAKFLCQEAAKKDELNWGAILIEEIAEAIDAAAIEDEELLVKELTQTAAVCIQWIQCINRRRAEKEIAERNKEEEKRMQEKN